LGKPLTDAAVNEFKTMIDNAIDREELDDVRQMLEVEPDLSSSERTELSEYLDKIYKNSAEFRGTNR
jgi:hypothetical protein